MTRDRFERRLLQGALLFFAALVVLGFAAHPIDILDDDFAGMAEGLLRGTLPRDPYRPMLYPVLTAGLGALVGDCFVAGRLVSSAAAAVFLVATALLARRCFGGAVAALASLLLVCNGHVLVSGVRASTDMLFAALSTLALWLAVRTAVDPSRRNIVGLAAACAFAYSTRYTALLLVLPALLALWVAGPRGRGRRILVFAACAVLFLVPHSVSMLVSFGSLLHDESWRNIALKHFGAMDVNRLQQLPFDGLLSVLLHDPAAFASRSVRDLQELLLRAGPGMLEGGDGPAGPVGIGLALLAVAGALAALRRPGGAWWIVLLHAVLYMLAVCVAFVPMPRVMVATLPVWYAASAYALARIRGPGPIGTLRPALAAAAALALVAGVALQAPKTIRAFLARQPFAEVAAARELTEAVSHPFLALCTYGAMWRLVPNSLLTRRPYDPRDLDGYEDRLVAEADEQHAEYIILGALAMGPFNFARVRDVSHPRLEVVRRDEEVLVLHVKGIARDWIESGRAWLSQDGGRRLSIEVALRPGVDPKLVHSLHVVATSPSRQRIVLPLEPAGGLAYATVQEGFTLEPGEWRFLPVVVDAEARSGEGPPFSLTAR